MDYGIAASNPRNPLSLLTGYVPKFNGSGFFASIFERGKLAISSLHKFKSLALIDSRLSLMEFSISVEFKSNSAR